MTQTDPDPKKIIQAVPVGESAPSRSAAQEPLTQDLMIPNCWQPAAVIFLVAVADFFFYGMPGPGSIAGVFLLLVSAFLLPDGLRNGDGRAVALLRLLFFLVAACFGLIYDPDGLSIPLALGLLLIYRMSCAAGWTDHLTVWFTRIFAFFLASLYVDWIFLLIPRKSEKNKKTRFSEWNRKFWHHLALWLIPVAVSLIFIWLFSSANPVLERFLNQIFDWFRSLRLPSITRLAFWVLFGGVLGSVFTLYFWKLVFRQMSFFQLTPPVITPFQEKTSFLRDMMTRGLILFNVIFLVENLVDVEYLWAGLKLPDGMTYASYAHRGAYPLIATALLAGFLVILTFRTNQTAESRKAWRLPRFLVYCFLAQNVFLTASSILRLEKYVLVYNLTELRFAAFLWMLLVAVGLILLVIRIYRNRNNRWLFNANLMALLTVLLTCGVLNIRGIIADYNVAHCLENVQSQSDEKTMPRIPPSALDRPYLCSLGIPAIPAMIRASDVIPRGVFRDEIKNSTAELEKVQSSWRSWTLRNSIILHRVRAMLEDDDHEKN